MGCKHEPPWVNHPVGLGQSTHPPSAAGCPSEVMGGVGASSGGARHPDPTRANPEKEVGRHAKGVRHGRLVLPVICRVNIRPFCG